MPFPSLQSRLDTYEKSKKNHRKTNSLDFALCGLYMYSSENHMTTTCYLCGKTLSYWLDDDIPFIEHLKRHKNCPLYQLYDASQRELTFVGLKMPIVRKRKLAQRGFFAYPLKTGHIDLFCYKCGYYVNDFPGPSSYQMRYHDEKCNFNHDYVLKSPNDYSKNAHGLFFIDLLSGRYKNIISSYLQHPPIHMNESLACDLGQLLRFRGKNAFLFTTKHALQQCLDNMLEYTRKQMENDENKINNLVEELDDDEK
ncbi:Apoptosis inhibitor IAP1, BIR domain protein [Trachipleistophora hominis]|uniref:Apoptosis inhibitor IAP1, BIR domain protein n=1 Tax=Trachipleistophora hominis TaxID=72359 RepID=L7JV57_TRAHO|nr:Apoptosis inhibitor IAP1, BIR domain protein [Trachipleistophora hominis]